MKLIQNTQFPGIRSESSLIHARISQILLSVCYGQALFQGWRYSREQTDQTAEVGRPAVSEIRWIVRGAKEKAGGNEGNLQFRVGDKGRPQGKHELEQSAK